MAVETLMKRMMIPPMAAVLAIAVAAPLYLSGGQPGLAQPPPALTADQKEQLRKQLFQAVNTNNISQVKSRVNAGADLNALNEDGLTAAGLAIERGYFDLAHYLLAARNQKSSNQAEKIDERSVVTAPLPMPAPAEPASVSAPIPQDDTLPPVPKLNLPPGQANPFDPGAKSNSLPIVGPVQTPAVKPALPSQPLRSNIKRLPPQAPATVTKAAPATKGPTPIKPLAKRPTPTFVPRTVSRPSAPQTTAPDREAKSEAPEGKGVLDKMVDSITGIFKSDEDPTLEPAPQPVKAAPPQTVLGKGAQKRTNNNNKNEEDSDEEGFISGVWEKITNIF